MGHIEEGSRKRSKRNQLRTVILQTVQTTGLIAVALVAPNVIGAMGKLGLLPSSRQGDVIKRSTTRLVKQGLLSWNHSKLRLTQKGERELRKLTLAEFSRSRPRRWDEKWRVLIFDIPEKRKNLRVKLRSTLQTLGFSRLQDSVWVYPYDCEDLIALLKADFHVGDDVRYMIADVIERDGTLRNHFNLKA